MTSVRNDSGMVTAETAVVMPVLVFLAWFMTWGAMVGIWQLRLENAARAITRAATMHVDTRALESSLHELAPGSSLEVTRNGGQVVVAVTRVLRGPGLIPDVSQHSRAVGRLEPR